MSSRGEQGGGKCALQCPMLKDGGARPLQRPRWAHTAVKDKGQAAQSRPVPQLPQLAGAGRGQARAASLKGQPGEHLHPAPAQGGEVSGLGQAHQGSVPLLLPALEYCKYLP